MSHIAGVSDSQIYVVVTVSLVQLDVPCLGNTQNSCNVFQNRMYLKLEHNHFLNIINNRPVGYPWARMAVITITISVFDQTRTDDEPF